MTGPAAAAGDFILPYQLDGAGARGRLVRLGPALDAILGRHAYPPAVAGMLAELTVLAALLAGALKYEGIFTLQTKGDGPIRLMVADVTSQGHLRAYAQFDAEKLAAARPPAEGSVPRLLGAGYLAFTVDQGSHTERYQGIVELTGGRLADCIHHYFQQSEQLSIAVSAAAGHDPASGWRAGGLMLQRLPDTADDPDGTAEDWRRATILMGSARPAELWDEALPGERLLYRLFHEEGVRVWPARPLVDRCRCSRERVATVLRQLDPASLADLKVDGALLVTCEFCSAAYRFDEAGLASLNQPQLAG